MSSQNASTPKKPARRGPKSKQIDPSDYCRILGCCLFLDSTGQSSLSRKALKATENLLLRVFGSSKCCKTKVRKQEIYSQVGSQAAQAQCVSLIINTYSFILYNLKWP